MAGTFSEQGIAALAEASAVMQANDPAEIGHLVVALTAARRIVLHGLVREGLQMRGLAMRLFHLGLDAHVLGDMTVPPVGEGDLLVVSDGPGTLATIATLVAIATGAGAKTHVVTAQRGG